MVRKELHLDERVVSTLEEEAQRQNRSLKNYLEFLVIEQAKRLEVPSEEYTKMMDELLDKFDNDQIEFSTIEETMNKNGLSN